MNVTRVVSLQWYLVIRDHNLLIRLLTLGSSITLRIKHIVEMLRRQSHKSRLIWARKTWWNACIATVVARRGRKVKHVWAEIITSLTSSHTWSVLRWNSIPSFAERRELVSFGGRKILVLLIVALRRIVWRWLNSYIISFNWVERHHTTDCKTTIVILIRQNTRIYINFPKVAFHLAQIISAEEW